MVAAVAAAVVGVTVIPVHTEDVVLPTVEVTEGVTAVIEAATAGLTVVAIAAAGIFAAEGIFVVGAIFAEDVEGAVAFGEVRPERKEGGCHTRLGLVIMLLIAHYHRVFQPGPVTIDSRLQNNSEDALVQSFGSLRINDNELPVRPDFGTLGTQIKLRTNFFPVKVPKITLYEHDVKIAPAVSVKRLKRRIFQLAEQTDDWEKAGMRGKVAHDHASKLISSIKLPQPLVIRVPYTDEEDAVPRPAQAKPKGGKKGGTKKQDPKEYTLTIEFIQNLDTQNLHKYVFYFPLTLHRPRGNVKRLWVRHARTTFVQVFTPLDAFHAAYCSASLLDCYIHDRPPWLYSASIEESRAD